MLNKHYDNWLDTEIDTIVEDVFKDEKGYCLLSRKWWSA